MIDLGKELKENIVLIVVGAKIVIGLVKKPWFVSSVGKNLRLIKGNNIKENTVLRNVGIKINETTLVKSRNGMELNDILKEEILFIIVMNVAMMNIQKFLAYTIKIIMGKTILLIT